MALTPLIALIATTALAVQRLWEMQRSKKNEAQLKLRGAYEIGQEHFIYMKVVHALWLIAIPLESFWRGDEAPATLIFLGCTLLVLGQSLRYLAITTLGERWTVRIIILPGSPRVERGLYRFIDHPNYLGVILEIAGFPLIFHAYYTAFIATILNLLVLAVRIRCENTALKMNQ